MQNINHNQPEYTVSEISGAIKRVVEGEFNFVRIKGEISEAKFHSSGHTYVTLKDEKSSLKAMVWKARLASLKVRPQVGLEVIATGKITTYSASSNYQLDINQLEPYGEGALMALLEKRKKEMAAKGLFDAARKKPIPKLPMQIAVVTSPTGAVIQDILHRIAARFPLKVMLWPVKVQGEGAEHEIAAAIKGLNQLADKPEVIIVARGGGSLEDLWCFNSDEVVYAVVESQIPIISAIGHETDTTLIDFAADLRAPTPTAAAEIVTQITLADVKFLLTDSLNRINFSLTRLFEARGSSLNAAVRGIPKLSDILNYHAQKLDSWTERLENSLPNLVNKTQQKLQILLSKLNISQLIKDISHKNEKLADNSERVKNAINKFLKHKYENFTATAKLADSYNYKKVLERGFAIVKSKQGKVIKTSAQTEKEMTLEFSDGQINIIQS